MVAGIAYVVTEWLTQSHLNTTDYDAAARGLRRTRRFKKFTLWLRIPVHIFLTGVRIAWEAARGGRRGRRSLVWSWKMGSSDLPPNSGLEEQYASYRRASEVMESQQPKMRQAKGGVDKMGVQVEMTELQEDSFSQPSSSMQAQRMGFDYLPSP